MAQSAVGYLELRHLKAIGGDIEMNSSSPKSFAGGQPVWMVDAMGGLRLFQVIRNQDTSGTLTRGSFVSKVGNANGIFAFTASTGTTTSFKNTGAPGDLVTGQNVGALAIISGLAASTAATEGEASVIVSNTSANVNVDSRLAYSAAPVASQVVQIISMYGAEYAASADVNLTSLGVIIGQDGISTGNYGFAQNFGICPRVNKDTGTTNSVFTVNSYLVIASGSGQCYQATSGTAFDLVVAQVMAPASSNQTQAVARLHMGGFAALTPTAATA